MDNALEHAAVETLCDKTPKPRKPWVSEGTLELITEKHAMDRRGDSENFKRKKRKSGGNLERTGKDWRRTSRTKSWTYGTNVWALNI